MKKAIITGINGQDGSYLAELLLDKGYTVIGTYRRSSTNTLNRIQHLLGNPKLQLEETDITDFPCIYSLMNKYMPDEYYNLAAQSHVATSFNQPDYTWKVNAEAVQIVLDCIKNISPQTRFYQASTSEMFGSQIDSDGFQRETTQLSPNSPYAIAKVAAHHNVRLYREAYGLHASSGVLFNHETLSYSMPLIIKDENENIDILPIGDIARFHTGVLFNLENKNYQEGRPISKIKVWDKSGWVDIKWVSGYPHNGDKNPRIINARNYTYTATGSHPCIMEDDSEINTSDLKIGDKVKVINYPEQNNVKSNNISLEYAEWLGMLVGDGNLNRNTPRLTNKDVKIKNRFELLWKSFTKNGYCKYKDTKSGFTGEHIGQIECLPSSINNNYDIYTNDISIFGHKNKKVPKEILNSSLDVMEAFLVGYNSCDGLKSNNCKYRFKNFKTNSPTLAAGLLFLVNKVTNQRYNLTVEESWKHGKQQFYYSINLLSDNKKPIEKYNDVIKLLNLGKSQREIHRTTKISRSFIRKVKNGYKPELTHSLELCNNEIKKIIEIPNYNGWFFDLETSSGTFHAGVGQGVVHNSPRRGELFVTRKITKWIGDFLRNTDFPKLRLGNLNAKRDWGYSKDYVYAMWLMLQQDYPDDYVISTGETHTIEEFLIEAFSFANLGDYKKHIVIDESFKRPYEVPVLKGDCTKAREKLGWKPTTSFKELVQLMVNHDIHNYS